MAGVDDMDGPAIGDRAPDVDFEGGGALWDYCRHPDYTLLTMSGGDDGAAARRIEERFGAVMRVATMPRSPALSAVYGPEDGRMYLVRPDGYVGFKMPGRWRGSAGAIPGRSVDDVSGGRGHLRTI